MIAGMITFYSKFVPNLGRSLTPLHKLLGKENKWQWDESCDNAFKSSKKAICSAKVLMHYDAKKPIRVTCDASDEGISGVLSHVIGNDERPVFFVYRGLTKAEKNYPILHREALAIVFAMEKFYKYVLGQKVLIITDHKPLEGVFKGKNNPTTIASRLQRYFHRLSIFDYTIKHKPGRENQNAYCLSRLPIVKTPSDEDILESQRSAMTNLNFLIDNKRVNLNTKIIGQETLTDETLSVVMKYVRNGWPSHVNDKQLKIFFGKKLELMIVSGCLVYGERVIIPASLKLPALKLLHANHRGIMKMKKIARKYFFWAGINMDIEKFIGCCNICQSLNLPTHGKTYGKWPESISPFERVHIDFFHKNEKTFLILVDTYSRWLEVKRMTKTTASELSRK